MSFFFLSLFVCLVFWRPQEWLVPWLYGWPILNVIFAIALLAFFVEYQEGRIKARSGALQPYLLAGLWAATIMSHVANTYFAGVMETLPETYKPCIFTATFFYVLDRPSRLRTAALIFVVMSCVMAVHALMQSRLGYGFAGQPPILIPEIGNKPAHTRSLFFGIFEDPNDLAQMFATSIPFGFVITRKRSLWGFLLGCAVAWLLVAAILTTHSRGGYVGLAAVCAIMLALILPARWLPKMLVLIVLAALCLCPLSAAYMDMSAHDRVVFWGMANRVFKQNWLFGIGYNMFWQVASSRAAHNAFVYCYTELGVFGYFFWFSLLALAFRGAWRARIALGRAQTADQAWLKRFTGLSIAAMSGFITSSYFLSRAFIYPLFFLFAMLGALPFVARDHMSGNHKLVINVPTEFWIGAVGALLSIFYIYYSIILLNKAFY
jgi:putative inorganic carbon (hco3(-)) transporter